MKIVFICTLLALVFLLPLRAQSGGETVTVEVQGLGKDAQSAEKNALYQAVERAVGTYLDNETVVKNEEVIRDKLLTVAQGFVQNYDVLSPPQERRDSSGLWEIRIRAVVKKSEVGAALRSAGVMEVAATGAAAWAAQITKLKSREDALALLEKVIPSLAENLVVCRLVQENDSLQTEEDPKTGDRLAVVTIRAEVNMDWWSKEAFPALRAALTAMLRENERIGTTPLEFYTTNGLKYQKSDLFERGNLTEITLVEPMDFNIKDSIEGLWPIREAKNTSFLLTNIKSSQKTAEFQSFVVPEFWHQKIVALRRRQGAISEEGNHLFTDKTNPAVTIWFTGDEKNAALLKVPVEFQSLMMNPLFGDWNMAAPPAIFCPLFEKDWKFSSKIDIKVRIKVPTEIMKQIKTVRLVRGVFGIGHK